MKSNYPLIFIFAIVTLFFTFKASAQPPQIDEDERQRWINELRNYKHDFITKELDLNKDQQRDFFAEYDQMEDKLNALNADTRELEQRALDDPDASDVELEATARAIFELKSEESKIELEYFEKFKEILNPKQLVRLKNTERKFTQQLVQHHRRLRHPDGPRRKQ